MEISDVDIEGAERNLLPQGMAFDEERRQFIKHLESCDLLAVPGSGKTTALQAKLFCISRHLPLDGNQGVLVLSHTNNAVNEIKEATYRMLSIVRGSSFYRYSAGFCRQVSCNSIL